MTKPRIPVQMPRPYKVPAAVPALCSGGRAGVKSVVSFVYPSFHPVAAKTADLSNKFIIQYNFVFRYWKTSLMNVKKI